jgi:SPP1 gp7 family putative phage head morphogenesis protein
LSHSELKLIRLLHSLHSTQAREVLSKLATHGIDNEIDLVHWIPIISNAAKPLLLLQWRLGIVKILQQVFRESNSSSISNRLNYGVRRYVIPTDEIFGMTNKAAKAGRGAVGVLPTVNPGGLASGQPISFSIYSPKVLDAVDSACFKFSRETLDTATKDLKSAIKDLKKILKAGVSKQQSTEYIAKRIEKIFADPMRAYRIATTEISRAQHAGQLMAAKESGFKHKRWISARDACKRCRKLMGKLVEIDKPFYVDQDGGPHSVVQHPPMHVNCKCAAKMER